ncbi:MAG: muconolactone Delta-isomerase family protein [Bacteroidota bacterium]|nr:muconolactone Delta-isomerase family protein [Bacteroidota bacterium]
MNRVFADISMDLNNPIPNMEQLLKEEHEVAGKWKTDGKLEHLFAKENANGVILVFKEVDIETVKQMIPTLPLYPYFDAVDYAAYNKMY